MPIAQTLSFHRLLTFLARRFVAGETSVEAVEAARDVNRRGIQGLLDFLGEHVQSAEAARSAAAEYIRLLEAIRERGVNACVSLKASQMGLLVSSELCLENLQTVVRRAKDLNNFVWLDMEGSALTQKTLDVFSRLRNQFSNVGVCLQACLMRTGEDLDRLERGFSNRPLPIRLCKGAYKEPSGIAFASWRAVNDNFRVLANRLIDHIPQGVFPAFATHDRALISDILAVLRRQGVDPKRFEFQMLYGIQNKYLETLVREGYRAGVYIPYGGSWFPYFARRLGERKENVYFLLRNMLD